MVLSKAKVLLVEDDPIQARETEAILNNTGYEVFWAKDGINAIRLVKSLNPDIILLDLILPGLDGYAVCRWLKLDETAKGIPIIMLTVKKELSDKISGLHIGADDYLPKPYNELELNARIYASLRTKALQDELRIKNEQLEELLHKVNHMAITDALTGLYNRRKFHDTLTSEFARAKRYDTPFSLIMIDIDHFKEVNDNYGHNAGDAVLKGVSSLILKNTREIDTASRFGGEEFMVILPNTDFNNAKVFAERMLMAIGCYSFPDINETITVSIGIGGMPDSNIENEDQVIRCADIALYRAKQSGRNRVEVSTGEELSSRK